MDAQKFGLFVAAVRKEKHMTQAELAAKIQVTDKAVSRWERGLGFPDINTLIPLAEALDLSVLELMRSEKTDVEEVTGNQANAAITDTLDLAVAQRRAERRHLWMIAGLAAVLMVVLLLIDLIGWNVWKILMYTVMVMPPVFGIIAAICFLCYMFWQLLHHKAIRQTVIALCVSLAIVAVWMVILPSLLVMIGGFPVQG